ncbi:MAG: hypothetical protein JWN70_2464, partial [Planctomycetaceae bacterium]|nr:hypothetical protein [Planctomycetaceae bacterium]
MLKTLFALMILIGTSALGAEPNLPIDDFLPKLWSDDWSRRNDAGIRETDSWVNFDHKKSAGEVLSFVAQKFSALNTKVTDSWVNQASIEMFEKNGLARQTPMKGGRPDSVIEETLRHRIRLFEFGTAEVKHSVETIEFTYLYEGIAGGPMIMAHGYVVVLGESVLFVQHTAPNVITSDTARQMVEGLILKHLQLS